MRNVIKWPVKNTIPRIFILMPAHNEMSQNFALENLQFYYFVQKSKSGSNGPTALHCYGNARQTQNRFNGSEKIFTVRCQHDKWSEKSFIKFDTCK